MEPALPIEAYYRDTTVQRRLAEYCGARPDGSTTAAFIVGFHPASGQFPTWADGRAAPYSSLPELCAAGCDIARSLWDTESLVVFLDLDYQNSDVPGRPFTDPIDVLFKLEDAYEAVRRVLRRFGFRTLSMATGRGYHFVGRIPLSHPVVDRLTSAPVPSWFAAHTARVPPGMPPMDERHARAAAGLTRRLEYLSHLVLADAERRSLIPVVLNGTTVGRGPGGRECASIDLSHYGDPLDLRYMRAAFSTYQWHRARPDIFGDAVAARPPLAALPRHGVRLADFLRRGRDLDAALRAARRDRVAMPDVAAGMDALDAEYRGSALAAFHREFDADREALTAIPNVPPDLPPCVVRPLAYPNDLLLKPEYIQNLVRGLLSRGWRPAQVAALVEREYRRDHGWGGRWVLFDARTRADFDVRVFSGLVATGADRLVDFNCTSSQEKSLCPLVGCRHDLRVDRERLLARFAS